MTQKKIFFQEKSLIEIKEYDTLREISNNIINNIIYCKQNEGLIVQANLIPEQYVNSRKFLKHGKDLKIPRFKSQKDALIQRLTPVQLRTQAFKKVSAKPLAKYSFKPFIGTDARTRNVSLVEDLEGILIYGYTHQDIPFRPTIAVHPYHDANRVTQDGAEVLVKVPSRTKGQGNYEIKFSSIPVVDSDRKWGITNSIATNHSCKRKTFDIRYKQPKDKETSRQFNFCAHEIAGYLGIMDHYINKEQNLIPLQMNQFALPNQDTVNFYSKLRNNCLIQTSKDKNPRKMNKGEKEILLWGLVHKKGHNKTFSIVGESKIKEYNFR